MMPHSRWLPNLWHDAARNAAKGRLRPAALAALLAAATSCAVGQATDNDPAAPLLSGAPAPQVTIRENSAIGPCRVLPKGARQGETLAAGAAERAVEAAGFEIQSVGVDLPECPPLPFVNWLARFTTGPEVKPLSPRQKARLALRNVVDPFNALTIVGEAAISIGSDSHSAYGPGMPGFGRYVGVSFTQDLTGEFFCTFLVPSILHQDPHYHRLPNASIPRRVFHAISQVAWTQGDNGRGMPNYGLLVGAAAADEVNNLYVPGRQTDAAATAQRYAIGIATAPIDNFVTEFLPDVARHIHVEVVIIQRVINQVARTDQNN